MTKDAKRLPLGLVMVFLSFAIISNSIAYAACRNLTPPAIAYSKPNSSSGCPNGYTQHSSSCVPTSSNSAYAYANPGSSTCPSHYSNYSDSCIAANNNACHAYFSGGGSCPSGYSNYGNSCVSQ